VARTVEEEEHHDDGDDDRRLDQHLDDIVDRIVR
jgi:hypothetical protein